MFAAVSNGYINLLQKFPPHPIKSEAELVAVQEVIDSLIDLEELTPDQQDYLNLLGMLLHEYKEKHVPMPDISGVELLKVLIQDFG